MKPSLDGFFYYICEKYLTMKEVIKIIAICFLLGLFSNSAFGIIPNRKYVNSPEKMGLVYKELNVITSDNLKIKTWFIPAQTTLSEEELDVAWNNPVKKEYKLIDNEKRPTVIIANGDAGNMSYQQLVYAQYFTNHGYNVATFDWRGFGESDEWEMNIDYLVYTEFLTDYDAVIKEVMKQPEVDTSRIAVFGWSTGAYLSMAASSKYSNIKCFVAIGLMTSFEEVAPVLKKVPKNINRNLIFPDDYPKELQPIYLASHYNKSVFLIVGEHDDRTPVWMNEKIFDKLSGKKELWIVENASHTIIDGERSLWNLLNEKIVRFLDINLK